MEFKGWRQGRSSIRITMENVGPDRQQGLFLGSLGPRSGCVLASLTCSLLDRKQRDRSFVALGYDAGTNEVRNEHSKLAALTNATPFMRGRRPP